MNNKIKALLGVVTAGIVGYQSLLWIDQKELETFGYDPNQTEVIPPEDVPFHQDILQDLIEGKDIIPGLPEPGAVCAKSVRALSNTVLGEPYFTRPRHISKATYKITGQTEMIGDAAGINGDAWHMFYNIQNAGGELLYFSENPKQDSDIGFDFLQDEGQIGDIVGFYYPDSSFNEVASEAGAGFTHMGLVVGYDTSDHKRDPIVAHMFHSDQYFEGEDPEFMTQVQRSLQARLYNVNPAIVPPFRIETVDFIRDELTFQGEVNSRNSDDFNKMGTGNYNFDEPLIYVAALLRPNYDN